MSQLLGEDFDSTPAPPPAIPPQVGSLRWILNIDLAKNPMPWRIAGITLALVMVAAAIDVSRAKQRNQAGTTPQELTENEKWVEERRKLREAKDAAREAERQQEIAKRGPMPHGGKGVVASEITSYFRYNLRNYDSLEVIECSDVMKWREVGWCQDVRYRAENGFGGMTIEDQRFIIMRGIVVDVIDN